MKFEYEVRKGIVLNADEMRAVHSEYGMLCTLECLFEEYDIPYYRARQLAYEVRRYMNKYNVCEEDAIEYVLKEHNL